MKTLTISLKQKLTLILLSVLIVSINSAMAKSDDESQEFRGVYYGVLPCKDKGCPAIKATLSLKNRQNYLLVTQKAKSSSREYYEKGKYSWDDESGIVTLVARKDSIIRKFRIKNEAALIMLSPEGKPMTGEQRQYTLAKRVDEDSLREVHGH
ncbi:copper resistance protein NlpE [Methyloprofundus sp.]|uniref:copper resistance protein NlpE n=1 Tax=Methyloprofundus sp. TaxID=2020875 RepID=UPI003D132EAB